jgi:hypothetical protein
MVEQFQALKDNAESTTVDALLDTYSLNIKTAA